MFEPACVARVHLQYMVVHQQNKLPVSQQTCNVAVLRWLQTTA